MTWFQRWRAFGLGVGVQPLYWKLGRTRKGGTLFLEIGPLCFGVQPPWPKDKA